MSSLDLTKNTDPGRNAHWYTRERFYRVARQPWVRWGLRLGRLRVLLWGPRFFLSVSWRLGANPADPDHFHAVQVYLGWGKCDPTRTFELWRGELGGTDEERRGYLLTWTFKEMIAVRTRWLDEEPAWTNMGGA